MLQCVAMCCNVLQCVAMCCSASQCVALCCSVLQGVAVCCSVLQCVTVPCSVVRCVAVCYSGCNVNLCIEFMRKPFDLRHHILHGACMCVGFCVYMCHLLRMSHIECAFVRVLCIGVSLPTMPTMCVHV